MTQKVKYMLTVALSVKHVHQSFVEVNMHYTLNERMNDLFTNEFDTKEENTAF